MKSKIGVTKTPFTSPKKYKPLYSKKISVKTCDKIDRIVKQSDNPKWKIIDAILSKALGTKTDNDFDVTKWLKKF